MHHKKVMRLKDVGSHGSVVNLFYLFSYDHREANNEVGIALIMLPENLYQPSINSNNSSIVMARVSLEINKHLPTHQSK